MSRREIRVTFGANVPRDPEKVEELMRALRAAVRSAGPPMDPPAPPRPPRSRRWLALAVRGRRRKKDAR